MSDPAVFAATALTVVLTTAGWAKLRAPELFGRALGTYRIIPKPAIGLLVMLVPALELMFAALQWVRPLQPLVGMSMAAMFVVFTLLLLFSLLQSEKAGCGCFGSASSQGVSWFAIVRNLVLVALALTPVVVAETAPTATLPAVLSGVGAGLLLLVLDQGYALLSRDRFAPVSERFGD